jgi:hypothetical protein
MMSVISIFVKPGDEVVGNVSEGESADDSGEADNDTKGEHFHSLDNIDDFSSETLSLVTLLSSLNLSPKIESEPEGPDGKDESEPFIQDNCNELIDTEIITMEGTISVSKSEAISEVDDCLYGAVDYPCGSNESHD